MLNIAIQLLLLSIFTYLFNFVDHGLIGSIKHYMLLIFFLIVIATYSFLKLRNEKEQNVAEQYAKISFLFLLGFCIVHFQAYLDYLLGLLSLDNKFLWKDSATINKSFLISGSALVSFYLGYSLNRSIGKKNKNHIYYINNNIFFLKMLLLFLFALFVIGIDSTYLNYSDYGHRLKKPFVGYVALLLESTFIAIIIHNSIKLKSCGQIKDLPFLKYLLSFGYVIFVYFLYVGIIFVSGDRGPVIYLSLALAYGYLYIRKSKIRLSKLLIIFLIFAACLSTLGVLRRQAIGSLSISDAFYSVINAERRQYPHSVLPFSKELAASVRTLHIAVSNVPSQFSYFNGMFLCGNIVLIVPGLHNLMYKFISTDYFFRTSPRFLTFLDLGESATWGVGTTCVADVYLDFGLFGVVLLFLIFGFFCRKIDLVTCVDEQPSLNMLVISILYFSFSVYISRSNLFVPFTKIAYVLFVIHLNSFMLKIRMK